MASFYEGDGLPDDALTPDAHDVEIPRSLAEAVRAQRVVPFIGAGVSMGVRWGLFPSWRQLLMDLAGELEAERLRDASSDVRRLVAAEDYVAAAEAGFRALGAHRFHRFLRVRFRQRRPPDADLRVVRALWSLRPRLVITTNYDSVLTWGGPDDLQIVANDQAEELALLDDGSSDSPWLWHLHGTIDRLATVILAGSDYRRLYSDDSRNRSELYERALVELRHQLLRRPFLYVGFGLSDPYVQQQILHVLEICRGNLVPSYALMRRGEGNRGDLWENYRIQLIEYEDHGAPLAALLESLAASAFGQAAAAPALEPRPARVAKMATRSPAPDGNAMSGASAAPRPTPDLLPSGSAMSGESSAPEPAHDSALEPAPDRRPADPASAPAAPRAPLWRVDGSDAVRARSPAGDAGGTKSLVFSSQDDEADAAPPRRTKPRIARPELEAAYLQELRGSRRLLLLAPRRGGARTLARRMANAHFDARTLWLRPPMVPSCTEAEYFTNLVAVPAAALGERVPGPQSALELKERLFARAHSRGGEHLLVLHHDGGPLEHLRTLGYALRSILEEAPDRGLAFLILVAGEAACASLRFEVMESSLFSGAPVRHVPPLCAAEVKAILDASGRDGARWSADVHQATGGHPGLVSEAIAGGDALDLASVTARLQQSSSVRGQLHLRLAADDSAGAAGDRHARHTLRSLLHGVRVRRLDDVEDDLRYPEVRLYYDGLVMADERGETALVCEAVRLAAERLLALEGS